MEQWNPFSYPTTISHAALPENERINRGITDGLLRLSFGLEHVEDLIADLDQSLQAALENVENSVAVK